MDEVFAAGNQQTWNTATDRIWPELSPFTWQHQRDELCLIGNNALVNDDNGHVLGANRCSTDIPTKPKKSQIAERSDAELNRG